MKFYVVSMFLVVSGFIHSVYAEETSALEELTVSARPIGLQSAENLSLPISILAVSYTHLTLPTILLV